MTTIYVVNGFDGLADFDEGYTDYQICAFRTLEGAEKFKAELELVVETELARRKAMPLVYDPETGARSGPEHDRRNAFRIDQDPFSAGGAYVEYVTYSIQELELRE